MNQPVLPSNKFPDFRRTTILIVEDNADHLFLMKSALAQCIPGVNAVGVADRGAAMTYLETSWSEPSAVPRLILLDLYLPTRSEGFSALKDFKDYFRANSQPPIPVVMFSSSASDDDIKASYDHGVNAYMVKSGNFGEWLDYFESLRQYWLQTVTLPAPVR
jgi:CheY-like chemotaxis protein